MTQRGKRRGGWPRCSSRCRRDRGRSGEQTLLRHDEEEDGPIAWFEASEAIVDKDRDSVVVAGSEVLEVFDGPITLEAPPEHEGEE